MVLIQLHIASIVERLGGNPFRAAIVQDALSIIQGVGIDLAILDYKLIEDAVSDDVVDALELYGIPYLFVTGVSKEFLPAHFSHRIVISKPFDEQLLEAALCGLAEERSP